MFELPDAKQIELFLSQSSDGLTELAEWLRQRGDEPDLQVLCEEFADHLQEMSWSFHPDDQRCEYDTGYRDGLLAGFLVFAKLAQHDRAAKACAQKSRSKELKAARWQAEAKKLIENGEACGRAETIFELRKMNGSPSKRTLERYLRDLPADFFQDPCDRP